MIVIPAIDLRDGRIVRLVNGDYDRQLNYSQDPLDTARGFADAGATILHVVDLDGAKTGAPHPVNLKIVGEIARDGALAVEFGGGLKSRESIEAALDLGVERIVLGSVILQAPDLARWAFETYGARVVAGLDARDGMVATHGWRETSDANVAEVAKSVAAMGARRIIATDIARDGALQGPNLPFFTDLARAVDIPIIASGGVATLDDIRALRDRGDVEAVIVGRALYEGRFDCASAVRAALA